MTTHTEEAPATDDQTDVPCHTSPDDSARCAAHKGRRLVYCALNYRERLIAAEKRADDAERKTRDLVTEIERLKGVTRVIDGKFSIIGGQIVKVSSGEVVPEDEPLVLMRGRDRLMVATLNHYRRLCQLDGCTDFQLGLADELIAKFVAYASDPARMKQPGVTRGAAWNPEGARMLCEIHGSNVHICNDRCTYTVERS